MESKKISNREQLQLAKMFNENGEAQVYVYEPNSKQFQILRKYKEEGGRKGLKVLFDVAIIDGATRLEYVGKDATTLAKVITGEAKSNGKTRTKKVQTAAEKVDALRAEWDAIRERQMEIAELTGNKLPKMPKADKLDFSEYLASLEEAERTERVQRATAEMSIEELLAEVARRQAEQAQ